MFHRVNRASDITAVRGKNITGSTAPVVIIQWYQIIINLDKPLWHQFAVKSFKKHQRSSNLNASVVITVLTNWLLTVTLVVMVTNLIELGGTEKGKNSSPHDTATHALRV